MTNIENKNLDAAQKLTDTLLVELLNTLAHDLRTPLSIFSSDLHYLATRYGESEVAGTKSALLKITNLVDSIAYEHGQKDLAKPFFAYEIESSLKLTRLGNGDDQLIVNGNKQILLKALNDLVSILADDSPSTISYQPLYITITISNKLIRTEADKKYFILSRIALNQEGMRIKLLYAELLLRLNGFELSLDDTKLKILVPVCKNQES
jgi:signal transduction histidine kinase